MSWHSNAYCLARLLVVDGHLYWRAWTRRMMTSLRVLRRNPVVQVQVSIVLVYCICMRRWNIDDRSCFVLLFLFVHFSCTSLASLVRLSSHDWWLEVLGHLYFNCIQVQMQWIRSSQSIGNEMWIIHSGIASGVAKWQPLRLEGPVLPKIYVLFMIFIHVFIHVLWCLCMIMQHWLSYVWKGFWMAFSTGSWSFLLQVFRRLCPPFHAVSGAGKRRVDGVVPGPGEWPKPGMWRSRRRWCIAPTLQCAALSCRPSWEQSRIKIITTTCWLIRRTEYRSMSSSPKFSAGRCLQFLMCHIM